MSSLFGKGHIPVLEPNLNRPLRHVDLLRNTLSDNRSRGGVLVELDLERAQLVLCSTLTLGILLLLREGALARGSTRIAARAVLTWRRRGGGRRKRRWRIGRGELDIDSEVERGRAGRRGFGSHARIEEIQNGGWRRIWLKASGATNAVGILRTKQARR